MIATKCLFQLIVCFAFVAHHVRSDDCCDYADVCLYGDYLGNDYEPYTDVVDGWTEGVRCGAQALAAFGSDGDRLRAFLFVTGSRGDALSLRSSVWDDDRMM